MRISADEITSNPVFLKLDIFSRGLRIDESLKESEPVRIFRTRAGLGSGIELIFDNDIRVNAPVMEKFARNSPYKLTDIDGNLKIINENTGKSSAFRIKIFNPPGFYSKKTSSGKTMSRIAVMQGSVLSVYLGEICGFWRDGAMKRCRFCTTGINVGTNEEIEKSEEDIMEVIREAHSECGITFVHFNSGYNSLKDTSGFFRLLERIKRETGLLTGIQFPPYKDLKTYNRFRDAGADHVSFCIEFGSEKVFREVCPGKFSDIGQRAYLDAIEYCAGIFPSGSVSGEIIAGIEEVEETKKIITEITSRGAFPTICVFRPLSGSAMEELHPPSFETMSEILGFAYNQMVKNNIPTGLAPGINVSIIITPVESRIFAENNRLRDFTWYRYHFINRLKQKAAAFYIKNIRIRRRK
ncbi:MAG: radical SAM protein [Deltaproteobacteria bacterium]|nr:radical SAM protein [Deltaproteobacteria bacterium]